MSVMYLCNDKVILNIKNSLFETLYNKILEVIDEKNLILSDSFEWFIEKLYAGTGGVGLDIAKYLNTKNDVTFFAQLVKEGMEKFEKKFPYLAIEAKERLWNFHKELLKYADELEK